MRFANFQIKVENLAESKQGHDRSHSLFRVPNGPHRQPPALQTVPASCKRRASIQTYVTDWVTATKPAGHSA